MVAGGFGILWIILHILGWILGICFIVWIFRLIFGGGRLHGHDGHNRRERWMNMMGRDQSLNILRERYAKGEITKEQYDSMRKDLDHTQ